LTATAHPETPVRRKESVVAATTVTTSLQYNRANGNLLLRRQAPLPMLVEIQYSYEVAMSKES